MPGELSVGWQAKGLRIKDLTHTSASRLSFGSFRGYGRNNRNAACEGECGGGAVGVKLKAARAS